MTIHIRLTAGEMACLGEFNDSPTAEALADAVNPVGRLERVAWSPAEIGWPFG